MKHFKYMIKVRITSGCVSDFMDWYSGETEAQARELLLEDMHRYGIKPEWAEISFKEVRIAKVWRNASDAIPANVAA